MLLALILAQSLSLGNPRGPIFNQPSLMGNMAAFEAFPASGRGAGLVAPYPNWQVYSEQLDNAAWAKLGVGVAAPTVTADFGLDPNGNLTAERVQFAACPGGADRSIVYRSSNIPTIGTLSVHLKGTSGSGSISLGASPSGTTTCSFTTAAWTRCEVVGGPSNFILGCDRLTSANTGAADALVWGTMENEGATAAPYVRTTTVAMGYTPTGSRGEALTFARSTVAYATAGTDGLRLTAIADGDVRLMPVNQPRVMADADGVAGLLVEGAMTPTTIQARPLCDPAWADVGTPGCAANSTTGPFGSTTMALITDDSGAVHEGRSQVMATTSLTRHTFSCYLKAGTSTTAELSFTGTGNAAGDWGVSVAGLSTTTSTRVVVTSPVAYAAGLTAVTAKVLVGTNAAGTGTIYAEGCNHVPNATYATSFMDAAAAAVARAVDSAGAFTSASIGPSGCIAASVQFPSTAVGAVNVAAFGALGAGNNWTLYRTSDTAAGYQIGTATSAPAVASMGAATHRSVLSDNAGTRAAWWDAASVAAPASSLSGSQTIVWVGAGVSNGVPSNGIVSRVQVDPNPDRCSR